MFSISSTSLFNTITSTASTLFGLFSGGGGAQDRIGVADGGSGGTTTYSTASYGPASGLKVRGSLGLLKIRHQMLKVPFLHFCGSLLSLTALVVFQSSVFRSFTLAGAFSVLSLNVNGPFLYELDLLLTGIQVLFTQRPHKSLVSTALSN